MSKKFLLDIDKAPKKSLYKAQRKQHFNNITKSCYQSYKTEFDFNPKGKTFMFVLTENTCFKLRYGKCSLTLSCLDKLKIFLYKIMQPEEYTYTKRKKWHPDYCPNLIKSLYTLPRYTELIVITKFSCGHYGFNDGQHRTCIAAALQQKVDVLIRDYDKQCPCCLVQDNSFFFKKL